jgi:diguanylate cyclase (GGDEF)-like protein
MINFSGFKVVSLLWHNARQKLTKHKGILVTVPSITAIIIGVNFTGAFQSLELGILDQFFRLRPLESPDERIVVVTVDDLDITKIQHWPISDRIMAQVLRKIEKQKPIAIGLDIYRDIPVPPGHEELIEVFESFPNIIGVEKVVEKSVNPPPKLKELGQVGFADLVLDRDGKIRRALLSMKRENGDIQLGLGTYLALTYLAQQGIELTPVSPDNQDSQSDKLKAGLATFSPLEKEDGGYIQGDFAGYQILLNYRGTESNFMTIPFRDILDEKIPPDFFKNRLVFIGVTAASANDNFSPPYSNNLSDSPLQTPGVIIHANIASQIISSALEGRNLIQVIPPYLSYFWVLVWSFIAFQGNFLLLNKKQITDNFSLATQITFLVLLALEIIIFILSYLLFLLGWWLPVIPSMISVGIIFLVLPAYKNYQWQHLANVDKLTQVANRAYFDRYLLEIWQQQSFNNQDLSLILCDIDYFKYYNDTYGHPEGDLCLQKVANAMATAVRKTDLVARYGGEEFVIILPSTDGETALKIAERIRTNVQNLQIAHKASQASMYVSISCGIATTTPNQKDLLPEGLIKKADIALYDAKDRGRNNVVGLIYD